MVKNKERLIILYANTLSKLTFKMMGMYHDHCHHYYAGLTKKVPEHLQEFIKLDKKYVFIAEEDEPYKPKLK